MYVALGSRQLQFHRESRMSYVVYDIDVILQDQDVRQRHHPGEQNRNDEWYGVDPTDGFDEEQYNIQSLS